MTDCFWAASNSSWIFLACNSSSSFCFRSNWALNAGSISASVTFVVGEHLLASAGEIWLFLESISFTRHWPYYLFPSPTLLWTNFGFTWIFRDPSSVAMTGHAGSIWWHSKSTSYNLLYANTWFQVCLNFHNSLLVLSGTYNIKHHRKRHPCQFYTP